MSSKRQAKSRTGVILLNLKKDFHLQNWFISRRAGGIEIMYLSRARKSKLEGFEYFVNNPIAKSLSTRLVSK